jgi:hypothetical protein
VSVKLRASWFETTEGSKSKSNMRSSFILQGGSRFQKLHRLMSKQIMKMKDHHEGPPTNLHHDWLRRQSFAGRFTLCNRGQTSASHFFHRSAASGVEQQVCDDIGAIAVEQVRCTTAVPENMLLDAF